MTAHGTVYAYRSGCRCDACTAANREYKRGYTRRVVQAAFDAHPPLMVEAEEARDHVLFLRSRGVSARMVAAEAGIDVNTVWRLTCGTTKRLQWDTYDRIMGVAAPDIVDAAPEHRLDCSHFDADAVEVAALTWPLKRCPVCGESWPANGDYWSRDKHEADGLKRRCKRCDVEAGREYYRRVRVVKRART